MRVFLNLQLKFNIVQTQAQDGQRLRVDSGLLPRPKLVMSKVDLPHRKGKERSSKVLVSCGEGQVLQKLRMAGSGHGGWHGFLKTVL